MSRWRLHFFNWVLSLPVKVIGSTCSEAGQIPGCWLFRPKNVLNRKIINFELCCLKIALVCKTWHFVPIFWWSISISYRVKNSCAKYYQKYFPSQKYTWKMYFMWDCITSFKQVHKLTSMSITADIMKQGTHIGGKQNISAADSVLSLQQNAGPIALLWLLVWQALPWPVQVAFGFWNT